MCTRHVYSCVACGCSVGAVGASCSSSGQCVCKSLTTGLHCDSCVAGALAFDASGLNPYGCSRPPARLLQPLVSPFADAHSAAGTALLLEWLPPEQPNGLLANFSVLRNGSLVGAVQVGQLATAVGNGVQNYSFVDRSLTPYTLYLYVLLASNAVGSTHSAPLLVRTAAGVPDGGASIRTSVSNVRQTSADVQWSLAQSQYSGPLDHYTLSVQSLDAADVRALSFGAAVSSARLAALVSYMLYNVSVAACSASGCGASGPQVQFQTLPSPPALMAAPSVSIGGNSSLLLVRWLPPAAPNGPITSYELWLRQSSKVTSTDNAGTRVFVAVCYFDPLASATGATNVPALPTSALVRGLVAYTAYDLRAVAVGLLGSTSSNWTTATTDEDGTSSGKYAVEYTRRVYECTSIQNLYSGDIAVYLVCLSSSSLHVRADGECAGHGDSGAQLDRSANSTAARDRSFLQPFRDRQLRVYLCIHFSLSGRTENYKHHTPTGGRVI